jgi:hypothetical protein
LTGSPAPALEILWQILVKIGLGDDGLNALLVWCRDVHGCVVDNLSDAFYDGMLAIVPCNWSKLLFSGVFCCRHGVVEAVSIMFPSTTQGAV